MHSRAKVDVLVPAYNASQFLAAALDSVIAQTFQDWRIVLINDGSTDDTHTIAQQYAAELGERFFYIAQQNKGLPAARNAGIRASSAEFLALLDADDVWLPNRLEASVRSLELHPEAGLSYGFVACIDPEGSILSTHEEMLPEAEGRIAGAIYTRRIDLPCPTITFRRSMVDPEHAFDETMRATEDRDLWLRIAQQSDVVRIPERIALYRRSPGGMTNDGQRMFQAQMRFVEKHRGTPGCDEAARREAISSIYRQRAETLGAQGKTLSALRDALHAILLRPTKTKNISTLAYVLKNALK